MEKYTRTAPPELFDSATLDSLDEQTRIQFQRGLSLFYSYADGCSIADDAEGQGKLAALAKVCGYADAAKHHAAQFQKQNQDFLVWTKAYKPTVRHWLSGWTKEDKAFFDNSLRTRRKEIKGLAKDIQRYVRADLFDSRAIMARRAELYLERVDEVVSKVTKLNSFDEISRELISALDLTMRSQKRAGNVRGKGASVAKDEGEKDERCVNRVTYKIVFIVIYILLCVFLLACVLLPVILEMIEEMRAEVTMCGENPVSP